MRFFPLALSLLAVSALAPVNAGAEEKEKEASADRQMVAPNIVTPVVRDGKLVNYLFVTIEVDFTDKANALKLRDRAHFLRDALLKASHRTPLGDPKADDKLNTPTAIAVFRAAAVSVLGAENIKSVSIVAVDSLRRS